MQNWLKKLLGNQSKLESGSGILLDDIAKLLHYLVNEIKSADEKKAAQTRLNAFLKNNPQKRLEEFPSLYIFLEQYLTELKHSKRFSKTQLHTSIRNKFPTIYQLDSGEIMLTDKIPLQKVLLARFFLLKLIQRSYHLLGATGDNMLLYAQSWLEKTPHEANTPIPFELDMPLPENLLQWLDLLHHFSSELHLYFEKRFSEQFAKSLLENTYNQTAEKFKNLSVFYTVIDLIPNKFLDEEKINLLSKQQLNQILFDKVDFLGKINTEIAEKNQELEQAQNKMKESERKAIDALHRLESVMDAVGEGIITINESGIITMVNNGVLAIWGYTKDEIIGQNIKILMPDHYKSKHQAGMDRFMLTGKATILNKLVRVEGIRKNGEIFPLELRINQVEIAGQQVFTAALRDLTDQVKQEEQIKVLARFPDENPQAVLRIDALGEVLYTNHASDLILTYWGTKVGKQVPNEWLLRIKHILSKGEGSELEYACGPYVFQMLLVPIPEAQYVNIYAKDITQRKEAEAQIIKQNKKIIDSIHYARRIQNALLREPKELKKIFPNSFILYQPRDIVSGDFYWFESIENKRFIAAVDCTGHGVPGAFMSMIGSNLLEEIILRRHIYSPDEILNQLHIGIRKALHQDETRVQDGMDISLCVIDEVDRSLEFAGAHNPLVYGIGDDIRLIRGNRFSIGGRRYGKERSFSKHRIELSADMTTFYIYTDGFQDQFGGERNTKLLNKNFRKILQDIQQMSIEDQATHLHKILHQWMTPQQRQIDDILVIGFQLSPQLQSVSSDR